MLDGDCFLKAGWIHNLRLYRFVSSNNVRYVIMGKVKYNDSGGHLLLNTCSIDYNVQVKHSQRVSATPLLPWVIVEKNGEVIGAHCTCMAG